MNPALSPADLRRCWDRFPVTLCINLRERDDRYREARAELQAAGLGRVTFVRTERQPDRDEAIIDAHMACLRHLVDSGQPMALIFEDDVQFQDGFGPGWARSVRFLETERNWQVFYLGGFIFRKCERREGHLLRGSVLTTHAYVIRTDFAREVLRRRPYCTGMSIDLFYASLLGEQAWVHVNPLLCIQRPSVSDGTWDKRSQNQEGWLGNAMLYTALDEAERRTFTAFSRMEQMRIRNGVRFFRVFRWWQRRRLDRAEARARRTGEVPVKDDGPPPVFKEEVLG